jgi:asparagine synthase (glutamine-hydrolysing)
MRDSMIHRGPDDSGIHIDGALGLASRRLSIIDFSTGRQPIHNEDRTVWVVLNGEIYNFRELRRDLEARGHGFSTRTDAEVVVHVYEEIGEDCVRLLKGMFAFALWDARRRTLLLARDRMGEKPLHYYAGPREFVFGSEIKALLQHPAVPRETDPGSLSRYLTFQYVPAPHSIFKGISKLQPGHRLVVSAEGSREIRQRQYWDIPLAGPEGAKAPPARNLASWAEECRDLLRRSVTVQLVSDAPVGVFLSGGIDSGLVAAFAAEAMPRIRTFTMGFEEPSFDESRAATRVARRIGSEHHETVCQGSDVAALLSEVASFLDEPLADASILPTYLLAKFARGSVKTVLSGDGGDELFAGYPTFQALRARALFLRLPAAVRTLAAAVVDALPVSHRYLSLDFKARQFLRGMEGSAETGFLQWMGAFSEDEKRALLSGQEARGLGRVDGFEDIAVSPALQQAGDAQRCMYWCAKLYLQDGVLVKTDRATMANGLEARAPYLDPDLVEFAARCPLHYKMSLRQTKILLRRAGRGLLPGEILSGRKKGFAAPVGDWIRRHLQTCFRDYLEAGRLKRQGLFDPAWVQRLLEQHLADQAYHSRLLWTLLMFQWWSERGQCAVGPQGL